MIDADYALGVVVAHGMLGPTTRKTICPVITPHKDVQVPWAQNAQEGSPARWHSASGNHLSGPHFRGRAHPTATYYIHADHLNTPRAITDNTNKVIWR